MKLTKLSVLSALALFSFLNCTNPKYHIISELHHPLSETFNEEEYHLKIEKGIFYVVGHSPKRKIKLSAPLPLYRIGHFENRLLEEAKLDAKNRLSKIIEEEVEVHPFQCEIKCFKVYDKEENDSCRVDQASVLTFIYLDRLSKGTKEKIERHYSKR